jgi:hypothetical protein
LAEHHGGHDERRRERKSVASIHGHNDQGSFDKSQ